MQSVGTVRVWHTEEGWGVVDCPDTPGGCWVQFSHLFHEDVPHPVPVKSSTSRAESVRPSPVKPWTSTGNVPEEDKTATPFAPSPCGPAGGTLHTAPSVTSRLTKTPIALSN